jgi:hypothetical protein
MNGKSTATAATSCSPFHLNNLLVEKSAPREATFEEFLDGLPPEDVRYAGYD